MSKSPTAGQGIDASDEIFKDLDDEDFRATLGEFCLRKVYDRLQATLPDGATE